MSALFESNGHSPAPALRLEDFTAASRLSALSAPLRYRAHGCAVVPLMPRKKIPLSNWSEFQHRHPTEGEIRAWWAAWPAAGVAIICGRISRLTVVDIDPRAHGDESVASLRLPNGPRARSLPLPRHQKSRPVPFKRRKRAFLGYPPGGARPAAAPSAPRPSAGNNGRARRGAGAKIYRRRQAEARAARDRAMLADLELAAGLLARVMKRMGGTPS